MRRLSLIARRRMAPVFAKRLIDEGLSPATPVIIAVAVGRERERFEPKIVADLLLDEISAADRVLIGIGAVFGRDASAQLMEPKTSSAGDARSRAPA